MWWFVTAAFAVEISSDPIPAGGGAVRVYVDGLNAFESSRVLAGSTAGNGPCFAALGGA